MIGLIVNGLSKAVDGYFEHSAKKSKAKSDLKIAEIEAKTAVKRKIVEGKVDWENTMADATKDSWKDEAWTLCFIGILLANFLPFSQPYIEQGFIALEKCPDWFTYAMFISISASFGIRGVSKFMKRK